MVVRSRGQSGHGVSEADSASGRLIEHLDLVVGLQITRFPQPGNRASDFKVRKWVNPKCFESGRALPISSSCTRLEGVRTAGEDCPCGTREAKPSEPHKCPLSSWRFLQP